MLKAAGYPNGLSLKFLYRPSSTLSVKMFQTLQSDLSAAGIKITGLGVPDADFYVKYLEVPSVAKRGVWDVSLAGWGPDWYGDAATSFFKPLFYGPSAYPPTGSNFGFYSNPTVTSQISKAAAQGSAATAARARVANVEGAADECDLLMANARQMRNGLHRALPVVGLHNIGFQTRTGSHQQHDGDFRLLQHAMLRDREWGGSLIQDDSIDPLAEQKIQIQRLFVPLVVTVAKKHAVARLLGGVLSGSHDCREKGIGDVRHHDAQGVGLLFGQAAGQQIWAIVQLANRGFHAPAQSGAHAPVVVDHCGHGEYRNFGFARHVVN